MRRAGIAGWRSSDHHHRRHRTGSRGPGGAERLGGKGCSSVRVLSKRTNYECSRVAESYAETDGGEY